MVWPATFSDGTEMFALPTLKPPGFTLVIVWHPEPLQSSVPIGKWLLGVETIVILANVVATAGA